MKVRINRVEYSPLKLREMSIDSLLRFSEKYSPERAEAYKYYNENECLRKNDFELIYKPFRVLKPEEALLRSMIENIRIQAKNGNGFKEIARRYEFMIFRYTPEIFEIGKDEMFSVKQLKKEKDMENAVEECGTCLQGEPEEFYTPWRIDEGTLFGIVEDEEGKLLGYFRLYFYEDEKKNNIASIDTTEPKKSLIFESKEKFSKVSKIMSFSAIATALENNDYVLMDRRTYEYLRPPHAYHKSKLKKKGMPIEELYSYSKHPKYKRNRIVAMNCFSEYFWNKVNETISASFI